MIRHPLALAAVLAGTVFFVLKISGRPRMKKYFKFLPPVFWIYFLPMLFSTAAILPAQSPVYPGIANYFLPPALILILVGADLRAIARLGRPALGMMAAGGLGVILSAPAVLFIFGKWLPAGAWSGFAALSASWTGGSANMIAVKEILGTPDEIFLPMVVVDTVVAYSWMGLLIALAVFQERFDRWNGSDRTLIEDLGRRAAGVSQDGFRGFKLMPAALIGAVAVAGTFISLSVANLCPRSGGMTAYTWTVLAASALGIFLSLTPLRKLEAYGSSRGGYLLLYFVLASIGARASLSSILSAPAFIAAGFVWVLLHGLALFAVSRLFRVPLALAATASQANIGGPASAPVVAAIYEPALAPVGLLLGILGNIAGTYCGLLCSHLCRLV